MNVWAMWQSAYTATRGQTAFLIQFIIVDTLSSPPLRVTARYSRYRTKKDMPAEIINLKIAFLIS
jgi:hypothetical protein